mgnify:CR=1 FL=1
MTEQAIIHPSAIIDSSANLGLNVKVGPYSVIGADVQIGDNCTIGSHVNIKGPTSIGQDCRIHAFSSIGDDPQHKGYKGEPTRLEIGDRNEIREYVSIHRGTLFDDGITTVGNDNLIMAYCHIAHDCRVGNHITMANGASMAGHAHIGDHCILGGFALVYQFVRVGPYTYLGFGSGTAHDVPPYMMVSGYPSHPHGLNTEGLKRHGFTKDDIRALRKAYKALYRSKLLLVEAKAEIEEMAKDNEKVAYFSEFLQAESKRGLLR